MSDGVWIHVLRALPWIVFPLLVIWRISRSRSLAQESGDPPPDAPLVTVVLPARNEAHHIAACVKSILSSTYPALELIVVDDHSEDGTGDLARAAIAGDARGRVIVPPPLPGDWFGKQWACACGVEASRGEILLFADADTRHAPDLVTRSVNALRARRSDLLSVIGRQEMLTFWERMLQPQFFGILAVRYGNTEWMERSPFAFNKMANGQCFLMPRESYDAVGGHAAVKHNVAEDLMLAQHVFRKGRRVSMVVGLTQLSTRMYASLGEIIRGWGKNIYAAGRHTVPFGAIGRFGYTMIMVPSMGLMLIPFVQIALALTGVISRSWIIDGVIGYAIISAWGFLVMTAIGARPWASPLYPIGSLMAMYIGLYATFRGSKVEWKGRRYISS